jgi:hypothetical protein
MEKRTPQSELTIVVPTEFAQGSSKFNPLEHLNDPNYDFDLHRKKPEDDLRSAYSYDDSVTSAVEFDE